METVNKKIILIGNIGVGKTSLVTRFINNTFSENYLSTIGVKIDKKSIALNHINVNLLVWDIAGEANFTNISKSYYLGAKGCVFVADCSRVNTFTDYKNQINDLEKKYPDLKIIKVVNKIDLLTESEIKKLKKQTLFDHYVSVKKGEFVHNIFKDIAKKVTDG